MKTTRFLTLLLCCFSLYTTELFAQKEAANWYFGDNAGVHFNFPTNLPPIPLTNGKMKALEGCASISDSLGNLLFYTAGDTVYTVQNGQHKKMDNGFKLTGHQSATQSSLIVPQPGSNRYYYLFTLDAVGGPGGLKYSVVDMKAPNGGKVLAKNVPLLNLASEKLTAVNHRSTGDVWVIAHGFGTQNGGKFYAYRVSANGIASPVVSTVGRVHGPLPQDAVGAMKASPDGLRLALTMESKDLLELFDFNDETGVVSKPISLPGLQWIYGVEFNPDGTEVYVSTVTNRMTIQSFDLMAARFDRDSIRGTQMNIGTSSAREAAALQLAPNYMIYIAQPGLARLSSLGISNSTVFKASFRDQSFSLGSKLSRQGLPSFNQSYFYRPEFTAPTTCIGDSTPFKIKGRKQFQSVFWNFRDPDSGKDSISTLRNPKHKFTKPGTYYVQLTVTFPNGHVYTNGMAVVVLPLPVFSLGPDWQLCPNDSLKLKGPKSMNSLLWSTGQTADSIYVKNPGRYYLTMTNLNGCSYTDTIDITMKQGPQIFKTKYYETCTKRGVELKKEYFRDDFWWENGSHDSVYTVRKAGWHKGFAIYDGCVFVDSVQVGYKECLEDAEMPNIITPNGDGLNDTFEPMSLKPGEWHLQLYNRWGTLIYEDKNYKNNWPKEQQPAGTYYYLLQKPGVGVKFKGWLEVAR